MNATYISYSCADGDLDIQFNVLYTIRYNHLSYYYIKSNIVEKRMKTEILV